VFSCSRFLENYWESFGVGLSYEDDTCLGTSLLYTLELVLKDAEGYGYYLSFLLYR
jgi:hypothetical protein